MNTRRKTIFMQSWTLACAALLSSPAMAGLTEPQQANVNAVTVILSQPPGAPNTATVEFYRSVVDSIERARAWDMARTADVQRILARTSDGLTLGKIPVVSRAVLAEAHPQVNEYFPTGTQPAASVPRSRVIFPVQEALDTLASQGAILVDCLPLAHERVRGCGLYYYDRAEGRIVAASRKSFRTGIGNVTQWAPTMVNGLKEGLSAHQQVAERDRLGEIMSRSDESTAQRRLTLGVGAAGENIRADGSSLSSIALWSLTPGMSTDQSSLGLELAYGKTSQGADLFSQSIVQRSAALSFSVRAHALEMLVWDLTLAAGLSERTLIHGDATGTLASQPFLSLRPGIAWDLGPHWEVGAQLRFNGFFGGSTRALGETSGTISPLNNGSGFASRSLGSGVSITAKF